MSELKQNIFISYSDLDKNKVNLIVKELENNSKFNSIVIAFNRDPLKPLAKKVSEGIVQAEVIIPILTKNSISTQWINQEIGYAVALNKKIMPIVEIDIIDSLKGFIHKQIDLPYNYLPGKNKAKENKDFIKCFRKLIFDLEIHFQSSEKVEKTPSITEFDKALKYAERLKEDTEFLTRKKLFLCSSDGLMTATDDVLRMFEDLKEKIKKLEEKGMRFSVEENKFRPMYIALYSMGYSFLISWKLHTDNSLEGAAIIVTKYQGKLPNTPLNDKQREAPVFINETRYVVDLDRTNKICWLNSKDNKSFNSIQIVDSCLSWLVTQISFKTRFNI